MSALKAKKIIDAINKGIAVNPTEIIIKHIEKLEVDGAFEEVETEKALTVLIYIDNNSTQINIDSKTQGTSYTSRKYKMLADKNANLEINPKNAIKFDCLEGHMEIKGTYPIKIENIICGYECDLERID